MNPISTRNSSNIPNPFSQNIMLTRPRRRIMHKGNPDGIRMKLSRRWWKLNIKLPPCIKRKKERRKKRWKQKGKKGGKENEKKRMHRRRYLSNLSNSSIWRTILNRVCQPSFTYLSQNDRVRRWLSRFSGRAACSWLLFSWTASTHGIKMNRRTDVTRAAQWHTESNTSVCSRATTVETWDNRIVSAVGSLRSVRLSRWRTTRKDVRRQ